MRTHYCGDVTAAAIGQQVTVSGWVHRRRDHGGRDLHRPARPGRPAAGRVRPFVAAVFGAGEKLRSEYVVTVTGKVRPRPQGTVNAKLKTGEVELLATDLNVLNTSETPPFHHDEDVSEELRLKYRYLDLRRGEMLERFRLRHRITQCPAQVPRRQRLHGRRNARAHPHHAGRRAGLHRAQPHAPGPVLRAAPVAAALQADPDDVRLRPVLPDRALLPRRGPARRPPARVHPDRHRNLLHGRAPVHGDHGDDDPHAVQGRRRHRAAAAAPHDLRGGHRALRHRPARPQHPAGAGRGGRPDDAASSSRSSPAPPRTRTAASPR